MNGTTLKTVRITIELVTEPSVARTITVAAAICILSVLCRRYLIMALKNIWLTIFVILTCTLGHLFRTSLKTSKKKTRMPSKIATSIMIPLLPKRSVEPKRDALESLASWLASCSGLGDSS